MITISNAYWNIGERKKNEDSLSLLDISLLKKHLLVGIVADGIGSFHNGEEASGYLIEELISLILDEIVPFLNKGYGLHKARKPIFRKLYKVSEAFLDISKYRNENMGTTLSMLLLYKNQFMVINLGDSMITKIKRKRVKELSVKHVNPDGSINKCVGSLGYFEPSVKTGYISKNTAFLIASDGFYRKISDIMYIFDPREIENESQIEKRLAEAARWAKSLGEKDNMSAIYIKCF